MSERTPTESGWFAGLEVGDVEGASEPIREGAAEQPADWPTLAIESGAVGDHEAYYDWLHDAAVEASRGAARERERADDEQLIHAVRAMDDAERVANELAERLAEWAGSWFDESGTGVEFARDVAEREPAGPNEDRIVSLASRVVELEAEAVDLRGYVERQAGAVAPNLAAMAGPVLAARLIALAGGLGDLAKLPSGTVQVLGAEDALFAHLAGDAPSPKHGVIYTHEAVRGTRPQDRGSAARALAGKLTIAARVDHYSGDRRPELDRELEARIVAIQSRADEGVGKEGGDDEGGDDERGNDEGGDDERGNDERGNDERGNDERGNDERGNDEGRYHGGGDG